LSFFSGKIPLFRIIARIKTKHNKDKNKKL